MDAGRLGSSSQGNTVHFETEDSSTTSDEDLVVVLPPCLGLQARERLALGGSEQHLGA